MPGELPQGWSWKRLGEHFTRINRRNVAGVRRVLTASGDRGLIDQEEFFNKRVAGADLSTYLHIKNGEFAYNRSAMAGYPVGAVKRLDRYTEGVVSSLYLCFGRSETATVDLDFAAQVLDSRVLEDELRPIAKVGARAHGLLNVSADDFMSVLFPTPPLPEQKKIAAILSSVDDAIQATQRVVDQTRRVKEGLLQDLLTRGLLGHTRFKETEIGEIPESWEVRTVDELLASVEPAMRSGPFGSALLKSELVESGIPVLGIDNVHVELFVTDYRRFITPEKYMSLARYAVRPNDVMITIMGTVGRCCVVPNDIGQAISSKHTWTLTFDPDRYRPYLACAQFNYAPWVLRHFEVDGQGGMMDAIRSETLRGTKLPVPPMLEQIKIEEVMRSIDDEGTTHKAELATLNALKSGLLQDLLTGKVRVSP